jgi:hypothetical protein
MNTTTSEGQKEKFHNLELQKGFYHSCTVRLPIEEVYEQCQKRDLFLKVLETFPAFFRDNFSLDFVQQVSHPKNYEITWSTAKTTKYEFRAKLTLSKAPGDRGTVLIGEAFFEIPKSKFLTELLQVEDPEPSMIVDAFLRRLKAQLETGEIATTEGQPSGREELSKEQHLH